MWYQLDASSIGRHTDYYIISTRHLAAIASGVDQQKWIYSSGQPSN